MSSSTNHEKHFDAWLVLTGQVEAPPKLVELPMLTGSMRPAIAVGDVLEIDSRTPLHCRAGEVAVFWDGENLVAHRVLLVLQIGDWHWILEKGDSNPRGRWRHGDDLRGRAINSRGADEVTRPVASDPALASRGLRQHIRHCLFHPGLKAADTEAQPDD